jgi:hypothetical protein
MEKQIFRRIFGVLFLASLLIVCLGCAGITLTKENKASLRTVCVCQEVPKPEKIVVYGGSETFAAMTGFLTLGVVGAVVASEIPKKRGPAIQYVIDKSGIDMGQIVRENFVAQLKNSGFSCSLSDKGGDAEFKLVIKGLSFTKPPGFTGNLQPGMTIEGSLVKPDGTILWQRSKSVIQGPARKFDDYINNPDLIKEAINTCSGAIIEKLVKDLNK